MALGLVRIDDRLIHGQVLLSWCPKIKPDRIILCHDEIAKNDLERKIYEEAANDYPVSILTVEETIRYLRDSTHEKEKILLLVESPREVVALLEAGIHINKINVGGMHHKAGKKSIAPYVYVDDEDIEFFKRLHEKQVVIEAQDLPSSKPINLAKLLNFN
ncbi:MAG: PTS mannose/fructose/sorbose transporter subunit IIB [Calditrichaeota bacterium]|nr:MAG: PTS mannose/fructose/sorbose transporter subunit IIB [Calditrichota bacterium]